MKTIKVNVAFQAENVDQLKEKLQAFQDLNENLEHDDLIQAVDVVVDNPDIVDFIKEVTPKHGQSLSYKDYIAIAMKAFRRFG